jgi:hypothetical protein
VTDPAPTDPATIDMEWIRDFRRQVAAMPKGLITAGEFKPIMALGNSIIVKRDSPRRGKWSTTTELLAKEAGVCKRLAARALDKARRLGIIRQMSRGHNGFGDHSKAKASVYSLELPEIAKQLNPDAWSAVKKRGVTKVHKSTMTNNGNNDLGANCALSGESLESARNPALESAQNDPLESAPPCILSESAQPCILNRPTTYPEGCPTDSPYHGEVREYATRETVDRLPIASCPEEVAPSSAPFESYDPECEIFSEELDYPESSSPSRDREQSAETSASDKITAPAIAQRGATPTDDERRPANRGRNREDDGGAAWVAGSHQNASAGRLPDVPLGDDAIRALADKFAFVRSTAPAEFHVAGYEYHTACALDAVGVVDPLSDRPLINATIDAVMAAFPPDDLPDDIPPPEDDDMAA